MGTFRLLAHPWWVNLLLLVPLVAYFLFRHEKPQLTRHQLLTSAIFALSFGFVQADRRKLINEKPIFHKAPAQGAFYVSPLLDDRCSLWRTSPDRNNPTDKEKTMSAKLFNYFDDYEILECHKCHWKGTFAQGSVGYYAELADCSCPNRDFFDAPMLAIVSYPTLEEARAHSDRPGIREWVQAIDRDLDEFAAQKLRTPEQLPEISAESFTLVWDFEAGAGESLSRTLIKHEGVPKFPLLSGLICWHASRLRGRAAAPKPRRFEVRLLAAVTRCARL